MKIRDRVVELRRVKASELSPHPQNWRQHPENQQNALRAALADIGYADALKVRQHNGGYQILDGHLRAETTPEMEVPVLVLDLDDDESKKLLATFDPLAGMAEANQDMLKGLLTEIELPDDLGAALDGLIDDKPEVKQDEVPEVQDEAVTKTGDVWKCGEHRVVCGDATNGIPRADAVVTDPPYGIGFEYESISDDRSSWYSLMDSIVPIIQASASVLVMPCSGIDRLGWWYTNHRPDWMVAWYKGSPGHRSHVGFNDWEPHLVWGKPPSQIHDYFQTKCGFEIKGHPCPKPVDWASWLIDHFSEDAGLICDPFSGSGTTLVAAHQLDRRCYGIEIEPKYVDVALKRYLNLTGDSPIRESDGAKFTDLLDV